MTIGKHFNHDYIGGSPNIPLWLGDRMYGQDVGRDFWYLMDRAGHVAKDMYVDPPFIFTGGRCSQGAGSTLNITLCIGAVVYSVDVPGVFGANPPPPVVSEDVELIRVESPAQTNMALPGLVTGGATNYVKLKYKDADGDSRPRLSPVGTGTYVFEQAPSFEFVVDDNAPIADGSELLLDAFTEAAGTFTFTKQRDPEYEQVPRKPSINAVYNTGTITLPTVAHFQQLHITGNITLRARIIIVEEDFVIDSGVTVALDNYTNLIVTPAGNAAADQNVSHFEIMSPGKGASNNILAGGGFGGYTSVVDQGGGGGYTTSGGDEAANAGGLPYVVIARFDLTAGIGGNGGDSTATNGAGGGGISGGGGRGSNTGGDGGPATLIIVKGNFINNGTITANGETVALFDRGGGGGGCIIVVAYGTSNIMGTLNAIGGDGAIDDGAGGGGGHIATLRASGGAPTVGKAGGTGQGAGANGSVGTDLNLSLASNPEYGLTNWGSTDAGILTANFIYQVFGYGWSIFA